MRHTIRTVAFCLAVFCLTSLLFSACTGEETTSEAASSPAESTDVCAYVFTVVYGDTKEPVSGVQVQICKGDSFCLMPVTTDANGVANYALGSNGYDVYDVHIIGELPEGYTFDNSSVHTDATTRSYTLTLTKSGSAGTTSPETSSEASTDTSSASADDTSSAGETSEGGDTSETGSDTTSTPDPSCTHVFVNGTCVNCGEKEVAEYSVKVVYDQDYTDSNGNKHKEGDPISGVSLVITNEDGSAIAAMGKTGADGMFRFSAPVYTVSDGGQVVGGYYIRVTDGVPAGMSKDDVYSFQGTSRSAVVGFYQKVELTGARKPYDPCYIQKGVVIHETLTAAREDDFLTAEDDSYYYYAFRPTSLSDEGLYRVSVKNVSGNASVRVGHFAASVAYVFGFPEEQDAGKNPSIEFKIEKAYLLDSDGKFAGNNFWLIGIKVEGDNVKYPVTFDLVLEKVRDLIPGKDYPLEVNHYLTLSPSAPKAQTITGSTAGKKLTYVSSDAVLVKDKNGYYHVGSVDGPFAMVTLKSANPMLGGEAAVNFCNVNDIAGVEQVCLGEYVTEGGITTLHYYHYYDLLNAYGKLCNADGAYVLNDELLTFLKGFAAQQMLNPDPNAYLIGVSYYK